MKYLYQNWSYAIFMGFYESPLFDSDTEYYLNEYKEEGEPELEIDFEKYTQQVSEFAAALLEDYVINDDGIIKKMKYKSLYSPRFYNYDTDRLNIEMDVSILKLKKYIEDNKTDFNQYLKDNFTSYDGFTSFIENNYYSFQQQYKEDKDRCLNVMIEYYILRNIYGAEWTGIKQQAADGYQFDTDYHWRLFDNNREYQMNNLIEVQAA